MGLAISGVPISVSTMLPLVRHTPTMKLHHTAALEMCPEYRPHKNGPRNAPASAPQEMPMSCAMNVMEELYCTNASAADTMMNTTMRTRIQPSLLCSLIFFTTLPCRRSSVSVEDEVSTSEDSVDMLADSTSTITMPMRISGKVDSMVGMMESYTGMPVGPISILSAYRRPKPPRK